ncbi:hypothetical protein SPRG_00425 [Saprolegnia parasitica CBS 223.65]|uniref:Large ribosomal subunit protein uL22c n=1 Tax=Saprolegnia parasitica (strain CBS 223.65) TaxID=695850 RepID=A0A067CYK7_SAPPC|nr:hypothetical protein SPRG_00425 [Saprolegnia parasitica CBS 223.65]KDO35583.1 hypothetical protein SPRG_00425 [Saprolegnia parasitica CBS 223.65]|eukprot:XP_012193914.1 hypothetical protein SPRG_00425 [Saprolegnia parasitica CBS 223.65]
MLSRLSLVRSMAALSLKAPMMPTLRAMSTAAEDIALPSLEDAADNFRTVRTMKKEIRVSPRKLTLLAQQIRGLPAEEALTQMHFSPKRKAAIVKKTVQNAINLADINFGIEPSNLKVAEAFVNKGLFLKRLKIMGRGRSGIKHRPHSHLTIVLEEFDPASKPISKTKARKLALKAQATAPVETAAE